MTRSAPSSATSVAADLAGKVALVTGSTRGIGLVVAATLAASGAHVVLSARHADQLEKAVRNLSAKHPGKVTGYPAHAGQPTELRRLVDTVLEASGRIDILVNNAATSPHFGELVSASLESWDKTFEVNVRGPFALIQATVERCDSLSSIVNIASVGGLRPGPGVGVYNVSKAALIMLTRQLAYELGPRGIRVNAVAPGLIKTQFSEVLWSTPEILERVLQSNPMRRIGTAEEVAEAVAFLASNAAGYVNGEVLSVDGGGGYFS
jgi:NAD(P)-dependent dehydrogenase (short-subunit alcohol dehydrogenase family)